MSARCTQLLRIDTALTADSVEWCPSSGSEHVLACGTYQLEESGTRRGSLSLFEWSQANQELKQIVQPETQKISDGILDMKWRRGCSEEPILALAGSSGHVVFVKLKQISPQHYSLCTIAEAAVASNSEQLGLCLSLDWAREQSPVVVAISDSLGQVNMVELTESESRLLHRWKAHQFEAWIVVFGEEPYMLYSGGDDCRLCVWDTRTGYMKPSFTSKRYQMGVCSLQVHPSKQHILASGSYDETLILWDTRNMAAPLKELKLGGGIWRIKWHWEYENLLATACMHDGFKIINCHLDSGSAMDAVASYKEHGSLAYGIDWCGMKATAPQREESDLSSLLASCSFYDHSLHIWTAELP